ncbi:hypothetical protein [uncultured Nostoc sp.]|uniref:hypothetical protein n=1 Tax=uncultured Nostoc sp. TaxID=340711 RepID=UPI0035CA3696
MLTLDREQTTALDYSVVNTSIQETFTAIDRFEWQASDELRLMRDKGYYEDGGHKSFEAYCESELTKHGGYRRVRDLLSAKKVVDTLPEELREKITKPSQTRSLLRLVKTPDKLHEAVAIASSGTPKRKCPRMSAADGHGVEELSQRYEQHPSPGSCGDNFGD